MRLDHTPPRLLRLLAGSANALLDKLGQIRRATRGYATANRFKRHGSNFVFDPDGYYSYGSISVGDHVNLGTSPTILATRAQVTIGNHVLFGPRVTIRGGNHRFDILGRYIDEITDDLKRPSDDLGVVIEDDVWVGGNATILHGVTIGRGSVVGANAVVVKSVPPYSIVGGNPARVIRARFTPEQIVEHEELLERNREHDIN
ncbi:acyltransferase [Microbacterium sp.]|uniref:acyltransferase n=1 Tax=Microbacterium sp. TaxID=51671 RepID=UPI002B5474B7|nr:acyltransferase [Microbacterium sp.]HWK76529.1 acyltransferase [Microbacterium sp.]